jgi:hypothetical protein
MQLPSVQVTRAIIQRFARLRARLGAELGERPLVLPNADFFPDVYRQDADSAANLTERMLEHAGMLDIPVRTRVVRLGASEPSASSCSSGACGVPPASGQGLHRVADEGESWLLQIPEPELKHPVALTTNLARSLAFIFLVETKKDDEVLEPPVDVTADFTAVALGFGPLMLQGSYIYAKSCGGPQIASVTKVSVSELAVAVALFAALGQHRLGTALKQLDVTQRSLLSEADHLLRANKKLIGQLRADPEWVARGTFSLEAPGGMLSNLLRGLLDKKQDLQDPALTDLDIDEVEALMIDMPPSSSVVGRPSRPPTPDPTRDELKNLVTESLRGARA